MMPQSRWLRSVARGVSGGPPPVDITPYVVAHLSLDGPNTAARFFDESGRSWSKVGNAQLSTSDPMTGSAQLFLDGTGDGIYAPAEDIDVYTIPWTIVLRIKPLQLSGWVAGLTGSVGGFNATTGIHLLIATGLSGELNIQMSDGTATPALGVSSLSITVGAEHYLTVCYDPVLNRAYFGLDGVVQPVNLSKPVSRPTGLPIMFLGNLAITNPVTNDPINAYFDDAVFAEGIAAFTSAYSVPSEAFDPTNIPDYYIDDVSFLMPVSGANGSTVFTDLKGHTLTKVGNVHVDTSKMNLGHPMAYFDGSGGLIKTADSPDLRMGASNFVFEMYFIAELAGAGTSRGLVVKRNSNATFREFSIYIDSANRVNFLATNTGTSWPVAILSSAITHDSLYYVAVQRIGNTFYLFLNNQLIGTQNMTGALSASAEDFVIGALGSNGDFPMRGWINGVRLTTNDRYPAAFELPTRMHPGP